MFIAKQQECFPKNDGASKKSEGGRKEARTQEWPKEGSSSETFDNCNNGAESDD